MAQRTKCITITLYEIESCILPQCVALSAHCYLNLKKDKFMKLFLASFLLLTATSSFAGINYNYKGINPINGDECAVAIIMLDNSTMVGFSINGFYSEQVNPDLPAIYKTGLLYANFERKVREKGIHQSPTFSSKRILFKNKEFLALKTVIEFKGKSLAEAESVSFNESGLVTTKRAASCNDLEIISIEEWTRIYPI